MTFIVRAIATASVIALSSPADAAAPKQLYNRTIKASWTVQLESKAPSGQIYNTAMAVNGVVYVSSAGRLFVAGTRSVAGRGSDTVRAGPGEGYGGTASSIGFQGKVLRATIPSAGGGGAVQIAFTFDPAYTTCDVSVVYGRSGKGNASYKGVNEPTVNYEQLSRKVVGQSCSIVDGNAFSVGTN